ncbi:MAG: translation elongation factor Ts [Anaerolineae bacterium]|jgi:elongation factor Ts
MGITTEQVKELRARTGAGVLETKNALVETDGDVDAAVELLRERGLAKAAKKASREASEGRVLSYIHGDPGRIGVLLEINCETDFVARTEAFQDFAHELAMQIAATNPGWVSEEDVPEAILDRETEIVRLQLAEEKKPPEIVERIVEGKIGKWLDEQVLLRQAYMRDDEKTVQDLITAKIAELGENIKVRRFARYELGEGL